MNLTRSFHYDAWANRRVLSALRQAPNLDERPRQIIAHLLMSQRIWITRIRKEDTSNLAVWPTLSLDECEAMLEENAQGYQRLLAFLEPGHLDDIIPHRTSTGQELHPSMIDILNHVLFHGAYHRGQLALALKRHQVDPPFTDYILFARENP